MTPLPPSDALLADPTPESVEAFKRYFHGLYAERLEAEGVRVWTTDGAVFVDDGHSAVVGVPLDLAHYLADCIRLAADTQIAEAKAALGLCTCTYLPGPSGTGGQWFPGKDCPHPTHATHIPKTLA